MSCDKCDDGFIVVCVDDMCRGSGECIHGDGYALCDCGGEGYEDDDYYDDPMTCRCGRAAGVDACDQCGHPLCGMCFEMNAGFCDEHPDSNA